MAAGHRGSSRKLKSLLKRPGRMLRSKSEQTVQRSTLCLEQLERREMLYGVGDGNALNFHDANQNGPILDERVLATGAFVSEDLREERLNFYKEWWSYGNASNRSSGSGEGVVDGPMIVEAEPNDNVLSAQPINLLPGIGVAGSSVAIINGTLVNRENVSDVDYFRVNLRGGDIVDFTLQQTSPFVIGDVAITDDRGIPLLETNFNVPGLLGSLYPDVSPLSFDGSQVSSYVIPTDGVYQIRVSEGSGTYQMRAQVFRPVLENQPVGTVQELFLDFDGGVADTTRFLDFAPAQQLASLPSLNSTLAAYGYTPAEVDRIITYAVETVEEIFNRFIPIDGKNGDFANDGVPGNYGLRITNSRDHGDRTNLPHVTLGHVGASHVDAFGYADPGLLGVADSIDIGNFDTRGSFFVFPDIFAQIFQVIPIVAAPGVDPLREFGQRYGETIAHEFGHVLGMHHLASLQAPLSLMDTGRPLSRGPDGIYGTPDDFRPKFEAKPYNEVFSFFGIFDGFEDQPASVSHVLASGTQGSAVQGHVFRDLNSDGEYSSFEIGIPNQRVFADLNRNGAFDRFEPAAYTDGTGFYSLISPSGEIQVAIDSSTAAGIAAGAIIVAVPASGSVGGVNFVASGSGPVSGIKFEDRNGNGVQDTGEPGMGGVYIYADLDGDDRPDLAEPGTYTAIDGTFFLNVPATGSFAVREVLQLGFIQTLPGDANGQEILITDATPRPLSGLAFGNQPANDFGDLPSIYETTLAQNGPRHGIIPGMRIGGRLDIEEDGQPGFSANGDDSSGIDDEDGIVLLRPIAVGDTQNQLSVAVTNSSIRPAYLQGWMDFNSDGDFDDTGEQIIRDATTGGVFTFSVPAGSVVGTVYARFRLSPQMGLGPNGYVVGGEVEDYRFQSLDTLRYTQSDDFQVERSSVDNVFDVLANDPAFTLEDFDATLTGVSAGTRGGTTRIENGQIVYTPQAGFVGREIFTYTVAVSNGVTVTERVTIDVTFPGDEPIAVDDSYDIGRNTTNVPLNVLANDIIGNTGPLEITTAQSGGLGTVEVASGGRSLTYTPAANFEGTEFLTYTVIDSSGRTSTGRVTVHVLPGDRLNDDVEFSVLFRNAAGQSVTRVTQGEEFFVDVFVDDVRAAAANPGVAAAFLDLLYDRNLVLPVGGNAQFDFDVTFGSGFDSLQTGSAAVPGIIDELGGVDSTGNANATGAAVRLATLRFQARAAGAARFKTDPADVTPDSDVILRDPLQPVPEIRLRYLSNTLEIRPNADVFPQAIDDSPNTVFAINSTGNVINVLANDVPGANGPIRLVDVTQPTTGSVSIDNRGTPNNPADDVVIYDAGATQGTQTFTYTIIDSLGFESIATVTVQTGSTTADDVIELFLEVTDQSGNPITQVAVGQTFQLRGYVQDLVANSNEDGVFAAYQDILISSPQLISLGVNDPNNLNIQFTPTYSEAQTGDILVPGLINEVGSTQNQNFPGGQGLGRLLQFTITITAREAGTVSFIGDPADQFPRSDTLLFDPVVAVDTSRIRYTDTTIQIVSSGAGTASPEGFTNTQNVLDVNNDGFVTAIDFLAVINVINRHGSGDVNRFTTAGEGESAPRRMYIDTNGDGRVTPLDALLVINDINGRRRSQAGGEGESATDAVFAADNDLSSPSLDSEIDAIAFDLESIKKGRVQA